MSGSNKINPPKWVLEIIDKYYKVTDEEFMEIRRKEIKKQLHKNKQNEIRGKND